MKTTKKDFEEFKKWVKYYIEKFHLIDYDYYFDHADIGEANARVSIRIIARVATFQLNTKIDPRDREDGKDMKYYARHEVCHLLIADVSNLVGGFVTEDESNRADEALTVKLTKLLENA